MRKFLLWKLISLQTCFNVSNNKRWNWIFLNGKTPLKCSPQKNPHCDLPAFLSVQKIQKTQSVCICTTVFNLVSLDFLCGKYAGLNRFSFIVCFYQMEHFTYKGNKVLKKKLVLSKRILLNALFLYIFITTDKCEIHASHTCI